MHLSGHELHSIFIKNANAFDPRQHNFLKLPVAVWLKRHSGHTLHMHTMS